MNSRVSEKQRRFGDIYPVLPLDLEEGEGRNTVGPGVLLKGMLTAGTRTAPALCLGLESQEPTTFRVEILEQGVYHPRLATCSAKGLRENISGFPGRSVSDSTTPLCHCRWKAARQSADKWTWLCADKMCLQSQAALGPLAGVCRPCSLLLTAGSPAEFSL